MIQFLEAAALFVPADFPVHLMEHDPDGDPEAGQYPHVVLWSDPGWEFSGNEPGWDHSLRDEPDALELNIRATYTGLTKESAAVVLSRTRAALNRARPLVAGWACSRLGQAPLMGIQADKTIQVGHGHPYYAVDEYRLIATKEK